MKIAYIVVGEDLSSPLLKRQVIELLGDINYTMKEAAITLFLFTGVLSLINHRAGVLESKKMLNELGISLVVIPNLCPWPLPNLKLIKTGVGWRPDSRWNRYAARVFRALALPVFMAIRLVGDFRVFHCRSYPSASAAILLKKIVPNTKVLFDPRSDFPEENVTAGNWTRESLDFEYWKSEERNLLVSSDFVACIGPTYVTHFRENVESFNYFIAPNNVKCAEFRRQPSVRKRIRRELGLGEEEAVFVYLGGMSESGWHRASFYKKFYDQVASYSDNFRFLFLVPSHSVEALEAAFNEEDRLIVLSPVFGSVAEYLAAADYGMMFLHQSKIAVGTKIGEYLAASLPVIVNANCLGAVELFERHPWIGMKVALGLGDLDHLSSLDSRDFRQLLRMSELGEELSEFAFNYFDNSTLSDLYIKQYRKMTCSR